MIESLKRHWIPIALFSLVPITSCTLISEVDRGLIDDGPPDASGGAAGTGARGGSSGTGGTGGSGGSNDAPTSNDAAEDAADDTTEDANGD